MDSLPPPRADPPLKLIKFHKLFPHVKIKIIFTHKHSYFHLIYPSSDTHYRRVDS